MNVKVNRYIVQTFQHVERALRYIEGVTKIEKLGDYVQRKIREKDITHLDVNQRSGGEISTGYLNDLIQGRSANPSVGKLRALARGIGVSEEELFRVARGLSIDGEDFDPILARIHELWPTLIEEKRRHLLGIAELFGQQPGYEPSNAGPIRLDLARENLGDEQKQKIAVLDTGKAKAKKK